MIPVHIQEGTNIISVYWPPTAIDDALGTSQDGVTLIFNMDLIMIDYFMKDNQYSNDQITQLAITSRRYILNT